MLHDRRFHPRAGSRDAHFRFSFRGPLLCVLLSATTFVTSATSPLPAVEFQPADGRTGVTVILNAQYGDNAPDTEPVLSYTSDTDWRFGDQVFYSFAERRNLARGTPRSSALGTVDVFSRLDSSGSGVFTSRIAHYVEAEFATGLFTPDGGSAESYLISSYSVSFFLSEPAVLHVRTGYEGGANNYWTGPSQNFTKLNGNMVPENSAQSFSLFAGVRHTLEISAAVGDQIGYFAPPERSRSDALQQVVIWGLNSMPGVIPQTPLTMNPMIQLETPGPLSDEPTQVAGMYLTAPTTGAVDAPLFFSWRSLLEPSASPLARSVTTSVEIQPFEIVSIGVPITAVEFPAGFGSAGAIELLFADQTVTIDPLVPFNFTDLVPGGVDTFSIVGLDGTLGEQLTFGLQFADASVATVYAGFAQIPEPSGLALIGCGLAGLLVLSQRRLRRSAKREPRVEGTGRLRVVL